MEIYLDYTITETDIDQMDEYELCRYLMFTDRDRKDLEVAETLYWLFVKEINRRIDLGMMSYYFN